MSVGWDPEYYLKFVDHRLRPGLDLLAQIFAESPKNIYDLGCGPGTVTRLLGERWPGASVCGIDSSAQMLQRAGKQPSQVKWIEADIANWSPETPADVIFSNAALHWLDDHPNLFPALLSRLAPGGMLAVQMPRNHTAASHVQMVDAARGGPWAGLLAPLIREAPVGTMEFYFDLLGPKAACVNIWECQYTHILEGENPVLQWVSGTALKPLLDALEMAENTDWKATFLEEYSKRLNKAYPPRSDGRTLFPFRRLFMVVTR